MPFEGAYRRHRHHPEGTFSKAPSGSRLAGWLAPRTGCSPRSPGIGLGRGCPLSSLATPLSPPLPSAVASLYVDLRKSTTHRRSAVRPRPSSSSRCTTSYRRSLQHPGPAEGEGGYALLRTTEPGAPTRSPVLPLFRLPSVRPSVRPPVRSSFLPSLRSTATGEGDQG